MGRARAEQVQSRFGAGDTSGTGMSERWGGLFALTDRGPTSTLISPMTSSMASARLHDLPKVDASSLLVITVLPILPL